MGVSNLVIYDSHGPSYRVSSATIARPIRTDARFLAHLVATRTNVAEYRLKNKISPEHGAAAYRLSNLPMPKFDNVRRSRSV